MRNQNNTPGSVHASSTVSDPAMPRDAHTRRSSSITRVVYSARTSGSWVVFTMRLSARHSSKRSPAPRSIHSRNAYKTTTYMFYVAATAEIGVDAHVIVRTSRSNRRQCDVQMQIGPMLTSFRRTPPKLDHPAQRVHTTGEA